MENKFRLDGTGVLSENPKVGENTGNQTLRTGLLANSQRVIMKINNPEL